MTTDNADVKALRKLPDNGERVIKGAIWTKFSEQREFKVSPKGEQGDYDSGCYWVSYEELDDVFAEADKPLVYSARVTLKSTVESKTVAPIDHTPETIDSLLNNPKLDGWSMNYVRNFSFYHEGGFFDVQEMLGKLYKELNLDGHNIDSVVIKALP